MAKRVYKQYCRIRDDAEKDKTKVKFSLYQYIEVLETMSGHEYLRKGEMMWEQEYYEYAKTAKVSLSSILART